MNGPAAELIFNLSENIQTRKFMDLLILKFRLILTTYIITTRMVCVCGGGLNKEVIHVLCH